VCRAMSLRISRRRTGASADGRRHGYGLLGSIGSSHIVVTVLLVVRSAGSSVSSQYRLTCCINHVGRNTLPLEFVLAVSVSVDLPAFSGTAGLHVVRSALVLSRCKSAMCWVRSCFRHRPPSPRTRPGRSLPTRTLASPACPTANGCSISTTYAAPLSPAILCWLPSANRPRVLASLAT
jgi:hypothetical protein